MADISMCINEFCPIKHQCYRYKAVPNEFWQSYGDFNFVITEDNTVKCDNYINVINKPTNTK
jgi:hypothetical protein